jgi:hypothetical protein
MNVAGISLCVNLVFLEILRGSVCRMTASWHGGVVSSAGHVLTHAALRRPRNSRKLVMKGTCNG